MSAGRGGALWWVAIAALTVTAGEAEHVRRNTGPAPGLCIGSVLLQGAACPHQPREPAANPL